LEDIYLPYKPKKRTKAGMAREKGLEPLAKIIMQQKETLILKRAEEFINEQVETVEDALQGARDIIAEWISENQDARNTVRRFFSRAAVIYSKSLKARNWKG
jgi:protein Tex